MDKILSPNDSVWQLLIILREMVEVICAPRISSSQVEYMFEVIENYLTSRAKLYPSTPLRPKHHYLLHCPQLVHQFGPLLRVWTLRFESKHRFFKRVVASSSNFVNVTRTLSNKHQLLQVTYREGSLFHTKLEVDHSVPFVSEDYCEDLVSCIKFHSQIVKANSPLKEMHLCYKVTIQNIEFARGMLVVTSLSEGKLQAPPWLL
ncbi:hypothetical protein HOLleu_36104 [Holothuria leucospilota]|uniref:Uncharacterized protein n=1 Tax=Holothuria leucospilota TaxID=206669 RepID=A0A9Q1BEF7_HOLLE|nr:hypothetical protein HOLleu_36104 [Holothuria leucospilota]